MSASRFAIAIACLALAAASAPIPSGSYRYTCRDIVADRDTLWATCRTYVGGWKFSALRPYRECGDIANINGQLVCAGDHEDADHGAPAGSYRQTCRYAQVHDDTLMAECRDLQGRWRYTELRGYHSCRGDIFNSNGRLGCQQYGGGSWPEGSWRETCRHPRLHGPVLFAECRDQFGRWQASSLDLRNCDGGQVTNQRGRLQCASYGQPGRITIYRNGFYNGRSLSFTADIPDLAAHGFANQASSAVIQGGVWQLCDKPHYRGYCLVLDRSHSSFWAFGFDNRTESLRRVR